MEQACLRTDYLWKGFNSSANNIELTYYTIMRSADRPNDLSIRYKIVININGKEKEVIYKEFFSDQSIIYYIARGLNYSRLNPKNDDIYVNNETKEQIDLTKANLLLTSYNTNDTNKKQTLSENSIKLDIKAYAGKLTSENKKIFRDNIIKFLYAELDTAKNGQRAKNTAENKQVVSEETIKQDIKKFSAKMTPEYKKLFNESIIKFLYTGID